VLRLVLERVSDGAARVGTGVDGVDTLLPTAHLVAMELVVLVILPNQGTGNEISLRVCEDTLAKDLTPLREELSSRRTPAGAPVRSQDQTRGEGLTVMSCLARDSPQSLGQGTTLKGQDSLCSAWYLREYLTVQPGWGQVWME
jgi:hypothetical protein